MPSSARRRGPKERGEEAAADTTSPALAPPHLARAVLSPAALSRADVGRLQRTIGNRAVADLVQRKGGKKSKQAGTFIGDQGAVHLHIDIANPHLAGHGARIDIKGPTRTGYALARLREARSQLEGVGRTGAQACRDWLDSEIAELS